MARFCIFIVLFLLTAQAVKAQYCGYGWGMCPTGLCAPLGTICCGSGYCNQGTSCYENKYCIPNNIGDYCGSGNYCYLGSSCTSRYDFSGYCSTSECWGSLATIQQNQCLQTNSVRDIQISLFSIDCLARAGQVCGSAGSERCCGSGNRCVDDQYCIPSDADHCGGGRYCSNGTACSDDGRQCITPTPEVPENSGDDNQDQVQNQEQVEDREQGASEPDIPETTTAPQPPEIKKQPVISRNFKDNAATALVIALIFAALASILLSANHSTQDVQSTQSEPVNFTRETIIEVEPNMTRLNDQDPVFDIKPMQLIFRRSQTNKPGPTFTMHSVLDLPDGVRDAAKHYGVFSEIVYIDPKLEEARALKAEQASRQLAQSEAQYKDVVAGNVSAERVAEMSANLVFDMIKWTILLPFYLIYKIYVFLTAEKKQIIRFSHLVEGKSLTSRNLAEIIEAENQIKENMTAIANFIATAAHYTGEEILTFPEVKSQ